MKSINLKTGNLFSSLWKGLNDSQFQDSVDLFFKRAKANNFNLDLIKNKNILDAGCGSGRYSVAMHYAGAKNIKAIDISDKGINRAKKILKSYKNIDFMQDNVQKLSFKNNTFDFVWSAGVIHHTNNYELCISEFKRVLKKNGYLFLLTYGGGGLRWQLIKSLRPILRTLDQKLIFNSMKNINLPENNIKHFMDDFYVPIQTLIPFKDLKKSLLQNNFSKIDRWEGNTFDHESDFKSQKKDMIKIKKIINSTYQLSNKNDKYLINLMLKICNDYLNTFRKVELSKLNFKEKKKIIIGEGNHRVICQKN